MPDTSSAAVVLAVNIGSSSLKFSAHPVDQRSDEPRALAAVFGGNIQGLEPGGQPLVTWQSAGTSHREALTIHADEDSLSAALRALKTILARELKNKECIAVAHRVVHGGDHFAKGIVVTPEVLDELHTLDPLAPLHQPYNLRGISAFMQAFADVPHVACFDTAFHSRIARAEKTFPLNQALYEAGVRRYGFHGLSYRYISSRLAEVTPAAQRRLLMAHLGSGSSLCACLNGNSFSTTMGFSAVGGLMMGTRCGDLDPGVILYLVQHGYDAKALENLLYRQSGLKGLSGISADMRRLREDGSDEARFAIEVYERRVIREAGGLIAAMGGVDAIAFAGGIGENDRQLRLDVCTGLEFMGLRLDKDANRNAPSNAITPIHAADSRVEIWVVPTDEGMVAAEEALAILLPACH